MGNGHNGDGLSQGEVVSHFTTSSELTLNHGIKSVTADEKKTVIAELHQANRILKKRKARIEVQPTGMEMLDHIVLTFVYAEYKRRKRVSRARSSGG
jgi:MarR-like DNA-binding transcriptional regulator SgrR of sgrS sRNA